VFNEILSNEIDSGFIKLKIPGGGSVCGREGGRGELTDISDLESNYTASAAGDFGDTGSISNSGAN
jgi:hypothetical protein